MRVLPLVLLILTAVLPVRADNHTVKSVTILERGQYYAVSAGLSPRAGSMGPLHTVHSVHLLANTTSIPAKHRVRFGLRYIVEGHPPGAIVELRMVTRFPNGGILDPGTKTRHDIHEYRMPVQIGVPGYRDYTLDEMWEIVPGRWIFEFWLGGRKLEEQEFCLFEPSSPLTAQCLRAMSNLSDVWSPSALPSQTW